MRVRSEQDGGGIGPIGTFDGQLPPRFTCKVTFISCMDDTIRDCIIMSNN
jgi:hypothetical protein